MMEDADRRYPGAVWSFSIGWGCDKPDHRRRSGSGPLGPCPRQANGTTAFDASGDLAGLGVQGRPGMVHPAEHQRHRPGCGGIDAGDGQCRGTTLSTDSAGGWLAEQAWFDGPLSQGSAGGISALFDRPAWQSDLQVSEGGRGNGSPRHLRAVADPFTGCRSCSTGSSSWAAALAGRADLGGATALMNQYLRRERGSADRRPQPAAVQHLPGAGCRRSTTSSSGQCGGLRVPATTLVTGLGTPEYRQSGPRHPDPAESAAMTSAAVVPEVECPRCASEVPTGTCGCCGCHLTAPAPERTQWLRLKTFGASPSEGCCAPPAQQPFPQLPGRSRRPFLDRSAAPGRRLCSASCCCTCRRRVSPPPHWARHRCSSLHLRSTGLSSGLPSAAGAGVGCSANGARVAWVVVGGGLVAIPTAYRWGQVRLPPCGGRRFRYRWRGMLLMIVPVIVARLLRRAPGETLDGSPSRDGCTGVQRHCHPHPAGSPVRRGFGCQQPPAGRAVGRSAAVRP